MEQLVVAGQAGMYRIIYTTALGLRRCPAALYTKEAAKFAVKALKNNGAKHVFIINSQEFYSVLVVYQYTIRYTNTLGRTTRLSPIFTSQDAWRLAEDEKEWDQGRGRMVFVAYLTERPGVAGPGVLRPNPLPLPRQKPS
jgi:hypothetical protein